MAPHSNTLAWKIPWMEEPGRLQSMGSLRVGHDRANSLSLCTFMHWRRKWQPTPVFLPGESQGWEPGGPPSMGSHRVGHNWSDLAVSNPIPPSSIINRAILLKFNSDPGVCLLKPVQGFPLSSVNTGLWNTYKTSSHIGTYYPLILGSSHTDFIFFYF